MNNAIENKCNLFLIIALLITVTLQLTSLGRTINFRQISFFVMGLVHPMNLTETLCQLHYTKKKNLQCLLQILRKLLEGKFTCNFIVTFDIPNIGMEKKAVYNFINTVIVLIR